MAEKIDRSKVLLPQIEFTIPAKRQLALILSNDFTLESLSLRIQVYGKGCEGFTYAIGFTASDPDDFIIEVSLEGAHGSKHFAQICIDPFSAHYLQRAVVDFKFDPTSNLDGFIVVNLEQEKFHGKFWHKNKSLIPPLIEITSDILWV